MSAFAKIVAKNMAGIKAGEVTMNFEVKWENLRRSGRGYNQILRGGEKRERLPSNFGVKWEEAEEEEREEEGRLPLEVKWEVVLTRKFFNKKFGTPPKSTT
ncbi:hypothetical protein K435DRAFT_864115 [Dendrothele bispora CBS 962.96]|uniref:Uncharacterized protein n=1 Tax=Dendrothele bispora (strain CBS 962.96) TaxID=1314807 RepID=A0A4S8LMW7_DENBC|nr:hypothetical protein K435DRAFT_864115 [Dendrothele bispora CBS 962.96]